MLSTLLGINMNALNYFLILYLLGLLSLSMQPAYAQQNSYLSTFNLTAPENDGPLNDYSKQVFNELQARTNIKFVIKNLPKQRALSGANMGDYDGVAMRVVNLENEYSNLVPIKQAIFKVQHVVFSHQEKIINGATHFENLYQITQRHQYKVGYLNGRKKLRMNWLNFPMNTKWHWEIPCKPLIY